jgi:hypothetical protein
MDRHAKSNRLIDVGNIIVRWIEKPLQTPVDVGVVMRDKEIVKLILQLFVVLVRTTIIVINNNYL